MGINLWIALLIRAVGRPVGAEFIEPDVKPGLVGKVIT